MDDGGAGTDDEAGEHVAWGSVGADVDGDRHVNTARAATIQAESALHEPQSAGDGADRGGVVAGGKKSPFCSVDEHLDDRITSYGRARSTRWPISCATEAQNTATTVHAD